MLLWLAQESREESTGPVVKTSLPRLHFSPQGRDGFESWEVKEILDSTGTGRKICTGNGEDPHKHPQHSACPGIPLGWQ